jgi:hypothetical protein
MGPFPTSHAVVSEGATLLHKGLKQSLGVSWISVHVKRGSSVQYA